MTAPITPEELAIAQWLKEVERRAIEQWLIEMERKEARMPAPKWWQDSYLDGDYVRVGSRQSHEWGE
jgi:hypothetical protein